MKCRGKERVDYRRQKEREVKREWRVRSEFPGHDCRKLSPSTKAELYSEATAPHFELGGVSLSFGGASELGPFRSNRSLTLGLAGT